MKIYLLRHGEYENPLQVMPGRSDGFPLSEEGKEQARQAGQILQDKNIAYIFSSPILRTRQTAEIVAKEINFAGTIENDDRLIEMEVGQYTNLPLDEFRNSGFYNDIINVPSGIESMESISKRMINFLTDITEKYKENILVVTHVYSIRSVLSWVNHTNLAASYEYKPKMGQVWEVDANNDTWTIRPI